MEPSWHQLKRFANHTHSEANTFLMKQFADDTTKRTDMAKIFHVNENRFLASTSSMIKANDPNLYNVKLDKFSGRRNQLFSQVTQVPLPAEGKNACPGGLFYDKSDKFKFTSTGGKVMPFTRTYTNRRQQIKHIEEVLKKQKRPRSQGTLSRRKQDCENIKLLTRVILER